jgi:hypothetical protein
MDDGDDKPALGMLEVVNALSTDLSMPVKSFVFSIGFPSKIAATA